MAVSSEGSDLDHLKANVTCPKCKELFKEPKLLPCLHCACVSCLTTEKGVRKHEGLKYIVACPVCQEERELPKSGLSSLPDAHFKSTMVKLYHLLEGRGGRCEECKTTESAAINSLCDHCGFICDSCVDRHKELRIYSEHKSLSLKESGKMDLSAFLRPAAKSLGMTCRHHPDQQLKMYCKPCKRLVCPECVAVQHKQPNHQTELISSTVAAHKEEMKNSMSSVEELRAQVSTVVRDTLKSQDVINQQRETAKSTISDSLDDLIRKLELLKTKLLKSVDAEAENKISKLEKIRKDAERRSLSFDELAQITDQCSKYSSDQEFMTLKHYVLTRLKEESQRKTGRLFSPHITFELPFSCLNEINGVCNSHFKHCHQFSAEKSSLSGKGKAHPEMGKLCRFVVHARTKSGHVCLEKQDLHVTISMPRTEEVLDAVVSHGPELGTYEVCYQPTSKGQYEISVAVKEEQLNGSPFFVSVKTSKLECTTPIMVCDRQEWPWGVACSPKREIYITRNFNHVVIVLDKDGRALRSFGIKGQKAGQFWHPTGIAIDKDGSVYVADGQGTGRVQKFNSQGQFIAMYSKLSHPYGVMVNRHGDKVYICDKKNGCVVILDNQLQWIKNFGELCHHSSSDGYESVSGHLESPHSIAEDEEGFVYVTDSQSGVGCVHVFTADGEHRRTFVHPCSDMFSPCGICIEDDYVYVCDGAENCLVVFLRSGDLVTTFGSYGKHRGQFHSPLSATVDLDGFLYVCDHNNARVQVF